MTARLLLLVLILLTPPLHAQPEPSAELQAKVDAEVARLGARAYRTREAASRALLALGEPALPLLRAVKTDNAEVRRRLDQVIRQLAARRAELAAALALAKLEPGTVTLLSRSRHNDYQKATFSFEHGLRDDPRGVTRNDWDLQYGNGGDQFSVTMVTDDRSRLADLGKHTWAELKRVPALHPHPTPTREPALAAKVGHIYLVRTRDRESDLYALFRVEKLLENDRVTISWKRLPDRLARQLEGR